MTLEERSDSADLHLVCDVAAQDEAAMFADSSCLPQLYLVAGHASCAALPDTVSAKQLTEIAAAGHGEVSRDWSAADHVTTVLTSGWPGAGGRRLLRAAGQVPARAAERQLRPGRGQRQRRRRGGGRGLAAGGARGGGLPAGGGGGAEGGRAGQDLLLHLPGGLHAALRGLHK